MNYSQHMSREEQITKRKELIRMQIHLYKVQIDEANGLQYENCCEDLKLL